MKILHINTNEVGGAANAAKRIHWALQQSGVDSNMLFLEDKYDTQSGYFYYSEEDPLFEPKDFLNRLKNKVVSGFSSERPISWPRSIFDLSKNKHVREADIIHLHWVPKFLDYNFFLKTHKPVVWTLHDMAPFSDGFHYYFDVDPDYKLKTRRKIKSYKSSCLAPNRIQVVSPSEWLKSESEASELFGNYAHQRIRYALDFSVYKVLDKSELLPKYSFSPEDKIAIFIADNINDNRKGFQYVVEILPQLLAAGYKLITVGNGEIAEHPDIHSFGHVSSEEKMAELYNLAHVFIMPSLQDNYPNTILESLACGTPVVVFENSGNVENIEPPSNGYIAKNEDATDLLAGALYFKDTEVEASEISKKLYAMCRPELISQQYQELYQQLINI